MENLKDAKPSENYGALKEEDVKETKEENASLDEGKQDNDEDHENPYHNFQALYQKLLETKVSYPERPGERDCNFYMRTGLCAYGARCRYNHPPKTSFYSDSFPERIGEPDCQHYLKTGTCRFGAMCKYHHPQEIKKIKLNTFGFPLREGERDCSFYMRTRTCKYGATCRFHHPELPILQIYLQVSASTFNGREEPYSPVLIPTQPLPAGPYWNSHSSSRCSTPDFLQFKDTKAYHSKSSSGCVVESNIDTMNTMKHRKSNEQEKIKDSSPESISNAGSDCNLHIIEKSTHSTKLTSTLLPLRPGVAVCSFFKEYGVCQLGPSCNYHHSLEMLGELSLSQKCLDSNPNVES